MEPVARSTFALVGGRVISLVDSTSVDALSGNVHGTRVTLTADSPADFSVARNALADSVPFFAVGRTEVTGHAVVVGIIGVVGVAYAEYSIEIAVGRTSVLSGDTVLVLLGVAIFADALSILEVAVVRADIGRSTLAF